MYNHLLGYQHFRELTMILGFGIGANVDMVTGKLYGI
jgi:hypothetical protein